MQKQNQNYNPTKREQGNDNIYTVARPVQSVAEELVSLQLLKHAAAISMNKRPPIPNIGLVPNRFGYRTDPLGIIDIISIDDSFSAQFGDFSGTEGGYGGTSFPSLPQT